LRFFDARTLLPSPPGTPLFFFLSLGHCVKVVSLSAARVFRHSFFSDTDLRSPYNLFLLSALVARFVLFFTGRYRSPPATHVRSSYAGATLASFCRQTTCLSLHLGFSTVFPRWELYVCPLLLEVARPVPRPLSSFC